MRIRLKHRWFLCRGSRQSAITLGGNWSGTNELDQGQLREISEANTDFSSLTQKFRAENDKRAIENFREPPCRD